MSDYGRGGAVLGGAVLPSTSAVGLILLNNANPIIVAGLFMVCAINMIILTGYITRYVVNYKRTIQK